jgi:HK97 family phage portal protein
MSKKRRQRRDSTTTGENKTTQMVWLSSGEAFHDLCCTGYTSLDRNPEIMTACRRIAELLGATTIYLMNNTADGDVRIVNELSRAIDIAPMPNMTRSTWMEAIVMNLLLYGSGNSIVVPHTWSGLLQSLEPISASRVGFQPVGYRDYKVLIDGKERDPQSVLHFVYNPDPIYLWKGRGVDVSLRDIANNLKQAAHTERAFMSSEYKPSIIVKVDGLTEEFASPTGRQKLLDSYVEPSETGKPWLIPAEQFEVEQVRPLTLADLAINDTVQLDKKAVAAILGVPAFMLGVGEYKRDEYNAFIQSRIMPLAKAIAAEMTKKLILNPAWYLQFNVWSLIDYDLQQVSSVLLAGSDRGFVNGDEWRDRMHMNPAGLKEYKILENYIPYDMSGNQSKLTGGSE